MHNVRGAAGFVGSDGKAIPLTEQEIYDLGVEHHEVVVGYELGDSVKITDGPLEGFIGTVDELEPDKTVCVSLFPCSAERRRSTSSLIRSKRSRIKILQERGAFKWHRK